jgi:L-lactate dehydrogenase (cytochrome)
VFDPSVTVPDRDWLRTHWAGGIVVKGVQRVDDARDVVSAGADRVAVSNHGGRQLDRAVTPLELLPSVVDAVGATARSTSTEVCDRAPTSRPPSPWGAQAAFVARPYLYALMTGGESGVDRLAALLRDDYVRTLKLLGVTRTADLDRDLVALTS